MILKSKTLFAASNEYYKVNVVEVFINMKLIIGNRESGTGPLFLI